MNFKKNISLITGIAIPILMILFVAASIYLPGFFVQPKFSFLYANSDDYYDRVGYSVQNGKLLRSETKADYPRGYVPRGPTRLFAHDVLKNESREISYEEAQNFNLDSKLKSPDGFEVVYGNRTGGPLPFLFFTSRDDSTVYIKKDGASKKLNLQLDGPHYYNRFHFIGWIIK